MRILLSRLLDLVFHRQREDRLSEEMQAHLDLLADEHMARGLSPDDARLAARKSFGGVDQIKERYRDQRGLPLVDALTQDLRYSIRMLGKERALTVTAVLALGIGIGASNVAFTMMNALFLRDLPVPNGHEIVALRNRQLKRAQLTAGVSYPEFQDWQAEVRSVADLVAYRTRAVAIGGDRVAPDQIRVAHLSGRGFDMLGVSAQIGRTFRAEEDAAGAVPVVVLSDALWKRRYGGDPATVGRSVLIAEVPTTVIGIMPAGEGFPGASDAWQPLAVHPGVLTQTRGTRTLTVVGRLRSSQTVATAQRELDTIGERHARLYPDTNTQVRPTVMRYAEFSNFGWWLILPALILVTGLVLLIACANTANMLLARAAGRSREIALRVSLGATRARIVRQLMIESLALALAAGVVGYLVSIAGIAFVDTTLAEVVLPMWIRFTMDVRVLAFLAALCLITPVLFGLLPALHLSGSKGGELLKANGRYTVGSRRIQRWTSGLVVAELGLSLVILTCTGILIRSMLTLRAADRVVDTPHLVTVELTLPLTYATADARLALLRRFDERLRGIPSIAAAGVASDLPFTDVRAPRHLRLQDEPVAADDAAPQVPVMSVGPRYFDALGVRVLRGRLFEDRDSTTSDPVVIVNQRFADTYFPNMDPLGRQIRLVEASGTDASAPWLTVVGVSPSVRQTVTTDAGPVAYVPYRGEALTSLVLVVRSSSERTNVVPILREELRALDAAIPLYSPQTGDQTLAQRLWYHRLFGGLFIAMAAVVVMVSTASLYVLTSHAVTTRTQEIGVRMAVGAPAGSISWLIGRRALVLVLLGCLAGAVGAYASFGLMTMFVAEAGIDDWRLLTAVAAMLGSIAIIAGLIPARRAARLDPVAALRHE